MGEFGISIGVTLIELSLKLDDEVEVLLDWGVMRKRRRRPNAGNLTERLQLGLGGSKHFINVKHIKWQQRVIVEPLVLSFSFSSGVCPNPGLPLTLVSSLRFVFVWVKGSCRGSSELLVSAFSLISEVLWAGVWFPGSPGSRCRSPSGFLSLAYPRCCFVSLRSRLMRKSGLDCRFLSSDSL